MSCRHCGGDEPLALCEPVPYQTGSVQMPIGEVCSTCLAPWEDVEWCEECDLPTGECECLGEEDADE